MAATRRLATDRYVVVDDHPDLEFVIVPGKPTLDKLPIVIIRDRADQWS